MIVKRLENKRRRRNELRMSQPILHEWIGLVSSTASLHGVGWYTKLDNRPLKVIVLITSLATLIALPTVLVIQAYKFMNTEKMSNLEEWNVQMNFTYPNITVCHPKFFDKNLMNKYNISDDLANFMIVALDITAGNFSNFMASQFPKGVFDALVDNMAEELNNRIATLGLKGPIDLFHLIAKRCDHFITFCDVHRVFYISSTLDEGAGISLPYCCGDIFEPRPFFSSKGTCFSTKVRPVEQVASIFSSIIVWLDFADINSPEMMMMWQGSASSDRLGAVWMLTDNDYPAGGLLTMPRKISPKEYINVGLSVRKVDRSGVSRRCMEKNETFESLFGMKNTYINCQFASLHFMFDNCSLGMYGGLKSPISNMRECYPQEVFKNGANNGFLKSTADRVGYRLEDCVQDCFKTEYEVEISTGEMDTRPLVSYMTSLGVNMSLYTTDSMAIHFYFKSFEYPKNILTEEGAVEFLSKIGGWMGLALGASVFSVIEIAFFLSYLLRLVIKKYIH